MLLAIDVGNSHTVFGVYDGAALRCTWRVRTDAARTADEYGLIIRGFLNNFSIEGITDSMVSSVVPPVNVNLTDALFRYLGIKTQYVSARLKMNIKLPEMQGDPVEVGADRIANACAAYNLYNGPCIILDYGTATKIDVVDETGAFVTGITSPGLRIRAEALFSRASLLSSVELKAPPSIIARNTTESVQAGLIYGVIGETVYIVDMLKEALGWTDTFTVGTGGLCERIMNETDIIHKYNPELTLEGIRILWEMNR